jgi:UDP-glucose 4-epimerase
LVFALVHERIVQLPPMPPLTTVDDLSGTMCVVTGGAGFIGSNMVHALVGAGARVRVVDALVEGHGGDRRNLDGVDVPFLHADIGDEAVADAVAGADVVFNVAGQVSHTASMREPLVDLELNTMAHARFLATVRRVAPTARIVHTSTRQVYGRPLRDPVDEDHPTNPVDINGVAKLAGEQLHLVHARAYDMAITSLRLTNVYGPRQRLTSDELGVLPVFLRRAMLGETIRVFGDGRQRRDCLHVDDVVAALVAATDPGVIGHVLNLGHPDVHELADIARTVIAATGGRSELELVPWPDDRERIDIGSFHTDSRRMSEHTGWTALVPLENGIADTVAFYGVHPWYLSSI